MLSRDDQQRLLQMHNAGCTHEEMAREFCVTKQAIGYRLRVLGIPARDHHITPEEEARRRDAHARGLTDRQAARELGMTRSNYSYWRATRHLPINLPKPTK